MPNRARIFASVLLALGAGCRPSSSGTAAGSPAERERLPTGRYLDPVAKSTRLAASFPLGIALSANGTRAAILLSGFGRQGVELVDRASGATQFVEQRAAFIGVAISADGRTVYASGGNDDAVYVYDWSGSTAVPRDTILLAPRRTKGDGVRYPAGIALSPDGRWLYAAENLGDSLAVVDLAARRVTARYAAGRYPYGVSVSRAGDVYVSAWGASTVTAFAPQADGTLRVRALFEAGRHPSAMLLGADDARLYVASASTDRVRVLDTRTGATIADLRDAPPGGPAEGSTPNALALSPDGARLYVAEADNNAVAIFDLATGALAGRVPTDWYPTALAAVAGDSLLILSAKGGPPGPNPGYATPHRKDPDSQYTLGQLYGTIAAIAVPRSGSPALADLSRRVAAANLWAGRAPAVTRGYPPIEHVVYVIKENRTFDQVFGDIPQADGDTSLVFFPRTITPNHHALAERFGIFDRFFVNAEVSADGHNWSTAAYATDYLEKTVQSNYSGRGRHYDYEGTNRSDWDLDRMGTAIPDDDVNEPANGYLWDLAEKAHITLRNYGEFVIGVPAVKGGPAASYRGVKPFLVPNTNPAFPGFDLHIQDQRRADIWIAELNEFVQQGRMPALEIVRLPNDHTEGASAGRPTPRAHMADNDLALGRMIEALSKTPFWKNTAVFVLEDDAQDGPDHVDSHRSPLLVISPWARPGVHRRWANTTDVIATIAELLKLGSMSQFDHFGEPLRDIWRESPDLSPYTALVPAVSLDERNPARGVGARESSRFDFSAEDRIDDDQFNRVLWAVIKGPDVPYPGGRAARAPEWTRQ
ncbi:MAG TPA: bifunctional YncE family protein/alkaline phosphatase family protein [Gemmatimonadaceae bacterium]|nr:bifunctional YncE family protein/alkaline phosphatase family protein [Gemmatimonadaceae bacterium]